MTMYEEQVKLFRYCAEADCTECAVAGCTGTREFLKEAANIIEELSKRIDRAVELYNCGVEKSAMYEALMGIAPESPKEE